MWKTIAQPHYFTKRRGLGPFNYFNPLFDNMPATSQESERHVCVLEVSNLSLFLRCFYYILKLLLLCGIFLLHFETIITVWYFSITF